MTEARLRQDILARIRGDYPPRRSGVLVFGRPAGPGTGVGHPDLFGVALGRFFALEIKLPGGKATPVQVEKIKDLRMCGAWAWVIHSTLDATRAVYIVKQGVHMTTPEEPIDFDAWFKDITSEQPAAPFIPSTEAIDEALSVPNPVVAAAEAAGIEVGEAIFEPEGTVVLDLDRPAPDIEDIVAPLVNGAERPTLEQALAGIQAETDAMVGSNDALVERIDRLDADIRAVGDRVTLLWEVVSKVEALLRVRNVLLGQIGEEVIRLGAVINKLLTEVEADDLVAPTLVDEPTPLDDVLPPEEAPRRGRRRKAAD